MSWILACIRGADEPVLSDRHDVLIRLSLRDLSRRVDAAERSVLVNSLVYIIFAALLWVWLVAPSFNLLGGAIRAVLSVISYLGYGIFGAANSPVSNFASYINLGYAIIAGTPVLALLAYNWLNKERQRTGILNAIYLRPDIQAIPSRVRIRPRRRLGALIFACIAFLGVTSATANRFFLLSARHQDEIAKHSPSCLSDGNWIEPWVGARNNIWGWMLPNHDQSNWCADHSSEWFAAFNAILPHRYYEDQIKRNNDIKAAIDKLSKSITRQSADITVGDEIIHVQWDGVPLNADMLESHFNIDPWKNWPDVRPPINLFILILAAVAQIVLFIRLYRHASGELIP